LQRVDAFSGFQYPSIFGKNITMLDTAKDLPNDPAILKGLVTSLASELKFRDILIEKLKHQLAGHRHHRFGARSETLDQLNLSLEDEEIVRATRHG
jgi:hypothetical protein